MKFFGNSSRNGEPSDENRPKPEDLLELAQEEERRKKRGALTIYLGYAAGVGKTYSMLSDALQKKAEGKDIVIGYVETHGRPETDALTRDLEAEPVLRIPYRGMELSEPDIDKILVRKPEIVLIDELAHTNAPGSRHIKRYQDVEELLNAGISVYTTLNIQHLESLNEAILQITGIRVTETIPDTFLKEADHIKLVDVPTHELQERLQAGKVYVKDMAVEAVRRFFDSGNLTALRQLALRQLAGFTDRRMLRHMKMKAIEGPWPAVERILVGIRPSPFAEQMVRAAYRMSTWLNAECEVLYVETESYTDLSDQEHRWLEAALSTAHKLGAHIVRYRSNDVTEEIIRYARANNVTIIILGKPRGLDILVSPVYRIMRQSKGIDIFLFEGKGDLKVTLHKQLPRLLPRHYLIGLISVMFVSFINFMLRDFINETNMLIIQLLPVLLIAYFFGRGASVFTAIVSILVFDYVFVEPYYTFTVQNWQYFISFVGYVVIALIVSYLATKLRYVVQQARKSEAKASVVSDLSRKLADAKDRDEVFEILLTHGRQITAEKVAIFLPVEKHLKVVAGDLDYPSPAKEDKIAQWCFINGAPAGRGTDTISSAAGHYVPLKAHSRVIGVMSFYFTQRETIPQDTLEMLETMGKLGALALERVLEISL